MQVKQQTATTSGFQALGVSEETLGALDELGYHTPTGVQSETIPKALAGTDLVVQSRTGTGKTAAFGVPIADLVDPDLAEVQALALAPTRELCLQVQAELSKIGRGRGLKVQAIYGGDSMTDQVEGIRAGAHIVAGTPGRVLDHLKRGTLSLSALKLLILDEADKMLDMGFAQEMSEILGFVPEERQTLLFSATLPVGIRGLIYNYLNEPEWVLLSEDFAYVKEVRHRYIITPQLHKDVVLYKLIESDEPSSSMIFCNTRGEVRSVAGFLSRKGLPTAMISSDLTQRKREQVMANFRSGKIRHLVATDVAARGIDIDELSHVFIYSTPDSPEAYIHRAGRTGRQGKGGDVISLVAAADLVSFNRLANRYHLDLEERSVPSDDEVEERRTGRVLERLSEAARAIEPETMAELAPFVKALREHGDGDRFLTYLLQRELAPEPEADADSDDGESEETPQSSEEPRRSGRRRRRRRRPR